jgi:hypothetical protein
MRTSVQLKVHHATGDICRQPVDLGTTIREGEDEFEWIRMEDSDRRGNKNVKQVKD